MALISFHFIHMYDNFSFFFQLLYLLFSCSCLQTQVQGKPYKPLEAEEKRFIEDLHESTQAIKNETSSVRGKREAIYNMTDVCKEPPYFPPQWSDGCVKGRYCCYNHIEVVCKGTSFRCRNLDIARCGSLKCAPDFHPNPVTIYLSSGRKIKVRRTRGCKCCQD